MTREAAIQSLYVLGKAFAQRVCGDHHRIHKQKHWSVLISTKTGLSSQLSSLRVIYPKIIPALDRTGLVSGVCSSVLFSQVSWGSRWLFYEPFARWHMKAPKNCNKDTKKRIENFSQSANAACFHVLSGVFVWRILIDKEWLWSTQAWADAVSFIEADMKFYYLLYAARYCSDMISLFFEHPRSDTFAYWIHHVATVFLVLLSAQAGVTRIGGVIMFFFDWADPLMLLAKTCVYLSRTRTDGYQLLADRLFELFAVVFFVTRNIMFSYIVWICCFSLDFPHVSTTSLTILRSMLIVLLLLMTFWLGLIIKAAINQFANDGTAEDIREDVRKKKIV